MAVGEEFWQKLREFQRYNEAQLRIHGSYDAPQISPEEQERIMMEKCEKLVAEVLTSLTGKDCPKLLVPRCSKGEGVRIRTDMLVSMAAPRSTRRFTMLIFTLGQAYKQVSSGTTSTRRDVFYEHTWMYRIQRELDQSVEDLTRLLGVPRSALHLTITAKGVVAGSLSYRHRDGTNVDLSLAQEGMLVPENIDDVVSMDSDAHYILVVEKDATFQKIVNAQFHRTYGPSIIITGKGYPDLPTRKFLFRMWVELRLPVLALTDADPYGLHIAAIYKFGSQGREEDGLTVPSLALLGVLPSEITTLNIPHHGIKKLTSLDNKKLMSLVDDMRIFKNDGFIAQIDHQYNSGFKAEIQGLCHISPDYLTSVYLPTKLREGSWII